MFSLIFPSKFRELRKLVVHLRHIVNEFNQLKKKVMRKDLDAVAAQARKLREWFGAFVNNHVGQSLQSTALADLGTLNRLLARDNSYRQIEAGNVSKKCHENSPFEIGCRQSGGRGAGTNWESAPFHGMASFFHFRQGLLIPL